MSERFLPWAGVVAALGAAPFEPIRSGLADAKVDAADRDAFLLAAAVGGVLRELVPGDAPAEALTSYGALLHTLYLHWDGGARVLRCGADRLRAVLAAPPPMVASATGTVYAQLPERVVWAEPSPGAAHEPVDGCFVTVWGTRLRVLAVLGARPERDGFTTVEAEAPLPLPALRARAGGAAPFTPVLPAGERMGFLSVVSPDELLWLGVLAAVAAAG